MSVALWRSRIFQHLLHLPSSNCSAMVLPQRLHTSGLVGSMAACPTPLRALPLSITYVRTAMHSAAAAATSPLLANPPAAHQPRRQAPTALAAVQAPVESLTQASPATTSSARRRGPKASAPSSGPGSLLQVPGVGPKNEVLFRAKGLGTLEQLRSLHNRHGADESRTRAFLQDEVGIRNKGHVTLILDYLTRNSSGQQAAALEEARGGQQQQQRQVQQGQQQQQAGTVGLHPKVTLSVEGNISAGKSTFLQILKESGIEDELKVVPEPVDKWQAVGAGPNQVNLLMEFYRDPQRFAYTFQNYVFLTRLVQERDSYSSSACRLLERSVFSDRMVFVRAVHNSKYMTDTELSIYDSWFSPLLSTLPTLVPNGFIYLRADPQTCYRRMQKRSRNEESKVQLGYLEDLHQHHEDWLWSGGAKATDTGRMYIPASASPHAKLNTGPSSLGPSHGAAAGPAQSLQLLDSRCRSYEGPPVPEDLKDSLFILDASKGPHMLPQLNQVPALVLNCNEDVDVQGDAEYRQYIAGQVRQYTAYVRGFMRAKATAQSQLLDQHFNGYFLRDSSGSFVYTTPEWHSLSHMDQRDLMDRSQAAEQAATSSMQTLQESYRLLRPAQQYRAAV